MVKWWGEMPACRCVHWGGARRAELGKLTLSWMEQSCMQRELVSDSTRLPRWYGRACAFFLRPAPCVYTACAPFAVPHEFLVCTTCAQARAHGTRASVVVLL
jgi:hypothetical protein